MKVKLRPRIGKSSWDLDDEADQALADKLAELAAPPSDPIPVLPEKASCSPKIKHTKASAAQPPQPKPASTVNAKELIEIIVNAYMAADQDRVTIEVRSNEILIEQVVDQDGHKVKHAWAIGISHYRPSSRKLIK